jgi:hypothetical protein
MAPLQPETAPQARTDAADEATAPEVTEQDVVQAVIAHFLSTTGTRCDQARHRKAIQRALKTNTPDEIKRAASNCASTWSNRAWATPAAVCKPDRVDEVLAQAAVASAPTAAAHRPFNETKLRLPREYVEQHRQADEGLREADERLVFEIRTGRRPRPGAEFAA